MIVATKQSTSTAAGAYSDLLYDIRRRGHYLPLQRPLCRAVGVRAAVLVTHLLAAGSLSCSPGGWVLATERYLSDGLGLSAAVQERVLASLQDQGLAEVEERGRRRYVRVDVAAIRSALDK
jgi:hypothetical protein